MELKKLHSILSEYLSKGKEVSFKWDCGGDEAFVYTFIDGEPIRLDDDLSEELELYIINKLDLPDAGEFSLKGEGKLIANGNSLDIQYQSTMLGYEDEDGWVDTNELVEEYSGKKTVFE